ncbi:glycosyltransferase family 4 protein [Thermaurantimonas sp.]|uniref:glycosyltransferase family 4 protein n=1 Tax=Thermaurantimonas sp. TaxID=2681568 RepID=UPI00391C1E04
MILVENTLPLKNYNFNKKSQFFPNLLWMRSFHPIYNPEMALETIKLLKNTYPEIKLYMAGSDLGYFKKTKEMVTEMGLENNVIFPGFLNIHGKNHFARICDIYICTNRIDNLPVSLLEMMALGLPIVTTNVGGIPYLIQNDEALLVPSEDSKAMAEAVERIINNPDLGIQMVKRGKDLVKKYDEDVVSEKWLALLMDLGMDVKSNVLQGIKK